MTEDWYRAVLSITAILFPLSSYADQAVTRQPGLWVITEKASHDDVEHRSLVCVDDATQSKLDNINQITQRSRCSKVDKTENDQTVMIESVCKIRNGQVTTRSIITNTDPGTYRIEAQARYTPPYFGEREITRWQEGKWTGPCPADMKPGDIVAEKPVRTTLAGQPRAKKTE
jgi:hypothetical protein